MKSELGLVHIYCGDGKGKTTAAMGLALRGAGSGLNVVIVQFLKDGKSSEIKSLISFPNVTLFANDKLSGFSFAMDETEKAQTKTAHIDCFNSAMGLCNDGKCDILILDEALGAISTGLFDEELLLEFIGSRPPKIELIITGRNPSERLLMLSDYVSEVKKIKHPYDKGISARIGIEK